MTPNRSRLVLACLVTATFLLALPAATAHPAEVFEHGRMRFLFAQGTDGCEVRVEMRHADAASGTLQFYRPPQGPTEPELLLEDEVSGTPEPDGNGWAYLTGPYTFPAGDPEWATFVFGEHSFGEQLDYEGCREYNRVHAYDPATGGPAGCEFRVEGSNLYSPKGHVVIRQGLETVRTIDVTPIPEDHGEGWQFEIDVAIEHDGSYFVTFDYTGDDTTHDAAHGTFFELEGCGDERAVPECAILERATPREDGSIHLEWMVSREVDGTRVYRAEGDGSFVVILDVATDNYEFQEHVDTDTTAGETYRYRIVPYNSAGEAEGCPILEAVAIPFFGAPLVGALALAGAVGSLLVLRRR